MANGLSPELLAQLQKQYPQTALDSGGEDASLPPPPAPSVMQLASQQNAIGSLDPRTAALLAGQSPQPSPAAASDARGPAPAATLARAGAPPDRTVGYQPTPGAAPSPGGPLGTPRPIGYTKAGYVPSGKQVTEEKGVEPSPETQAALEKEQTAAWEIEANAGAAAKEEQEETRGRATAEYNVLQSQIQAEEMRKAKQTAARDQAWNGLMKAQNELAVAQAKGIDPNRYFHNMEAPARILTTIGLFASGFASGMLGKPDEAMAFVKSQISNDIEAQKETLAGKERAYQSKVSMYGLLRQQGLDDEAATAGARVLALQAVGKKLDAEYATARDARTKLGLAQMMQKLEQERAHARGTFDEKASAKVQTTSTERYQPRAPIYPAGSPGGVGEKDMGLLFQDPNTGRTYKATNEESRKKVTGALDLNGEVQQLSDQYAAAAGKLTAYDKLSIKVGKPTEQAAQAQTLYFQLQGKFRQAANDGVWKKSEADMLAQQLQPPDVLLGAQSSKQASVIKRGAQQVTERVMTIEQPLPVQTGFGVNARGQRIPTATYTGERYASAPTKDDAQKLAPSLKRDQ